MKKNLKKGLCMLLTIALCTGVLAGCNGTQGSSPNGAASGSTVDNEPSIVPQTGTESSGKIDPTTCEEPMDISVTVLMGYTQQDSRVEKELEEKYNINIDLIVLPGWTDGPTALNTMMASDNVPSVIWWGWDATREYEQWKNAGLLVDVSKYLNKYTNMRDYYNSMEPMTLFYDTEENGSVYRMPAAVAEPACEALYIRQDWLDNLNLKVPTTVEELNEVMRAFTEDDPDGNGVDDTYGLGGNKDWRMLWPWIQSYDYTNYDGWVVDANGKVGYGPAMDNTKLWLGDVADLFSKGYIKPSVISAGDRDQEMANGGFGICYSWCTWNGKDNAVMQSFYENNPDANWVNIDMVTGVNGNPEEHPGTAAAWAKFAITSACPDPERLFAIWDDMATTDNYIKRIYGHEGEDYVLDENGEYNPIHSPDSDENTTENIGLNMFYGTFYRTDEAQISKTKEVLDVFDKVIANSRDRYAQTVEWQNTADLQLWTSIGSDIVDESEQYMWGVLVGQKSIEEWDNYINTLNGLGLQEAVAEAQTVYDNQVAKMEAYVTNGTNQG